MRDSDNYSSQAARCRREADEAILDNVRERALRSEAAWSALADRSRKAETSRDARQARELADIAPSVFDPARPSD
ncbi:hypothetical protein SAMN05192583_1155 [Sphingomonas gellani]|uniref:Uncharacterized protein n=1 Tax=Sphingomonas gellani TaxID=1166340 RepID=A0A1H8B1L4_9SPHN|nr:hypothetical protein [Sphingomonas gellani]SEM76646.1 hypothetical protein SAMN05192583_1155 [Sphingomonas gellani]